MDSEKKGVFLKALDKIEKAGNALPNPATLFIILAFIIIIVSDITARMSVVVTFETFSAAENAMIAQTIRAISLLSPDGIRFMVTSFVTNFTGFFPVGVVFTIMIGVAIADRSGFLGALLRRLARFTPSRAITPTVVFLGIMSNMASSTGYVVLVPLGAILFISFKRHPIAGLTAAFAGVSGGWAANLFIATNDPIFASISTAAAHIIDTGYQVTPVGNWYFMAVSTVLITILGTLVTDKIVEPRLGKPEVIEPVAVEDILENEKRGLKWAGIATVVYIGIILILLIPEGSILRHPVTGGILTSPFMSGMIFFMMLLFLISGLAYGIGAKVIKSDNDVVEMMTQTIQSIAGFLVLMFFAAQFVAYFNYSNMGLILSIKGAEFLSGIGFVGLPLLVSFILLTALINLVFAVDTAKWALMAPIFVPMFMQLGFSPELTQLAYRIGDSATNIIAPLMPFFPMMLAFVQKYNKKAGIGTVFSLMLPYSIVFLVGWIILFVAWYLIGLPLGPGAGLTFP